MTERDLKRYLFEFAGMKKVIDGLGLLRERKLGPAAVVTGLQLCADVAEAGRCQDGEMFPAQQQLMPHPSLVRSTRRPCTSKHSAIVETYSQHSVRTHTRTHDTTHIHAHATRTHKCSERWIP